MPPRIEFYRHQLGEDEAAAWRKVLDTVFLTLGPQVAAFERELGAYLARGREPKTAPVPSRPLPGGENPPSVAMGECQVVGTSSCSMGLLLALQALGLQRGDEVITTPMTFVSTANALLHLGARPVLADVEADTGLLDPDAVRAAIGPRTRGILPVHLYGQMADMRALRLLADRHSLFVLEDSAHGIEMERDGVRPGDLGDAAVFSFYATKNMTSGDGGAIATRDPALAARLRRLRNHGVSKAATERHGAAYQHWDMMELGWKANLTDLDAALLRVQLPKVEDKRAQREALVLRYEQLLASERDIRLVPRRGRSSHHLFTIQPPAARRDALLAHLGEAGIGTAVNYRAIHTLTFLRHALGLQRGALPKAEAIGDRTVSLPLFPTLSEAEVERVVHEVRRGLS